MNHVDAIAALREALDAARPLLVGRSIRERLEIARQIEAEQRARCGVEPLNSVVPASTSTA